MLFRSGLEPSCPVAQSGVGPVEAAGNSLTEPCIHADQLRPNGGEAPPEIAPVQPASEQLVPTFSRQDRGAAGLRQRVSQFGGMTALIRQPARHPGEGRSADEALQLPAKALQTRHCRPAQPASQPFDARVELGARRHHHFGGSRRRGRTKIGNEVRDGHVGLV